MLRKTTSPLDENIWTPQPTKINVIPHTMHVPQVRTHQTKIPSFSNPSLAASFLAAFFVFPRPRPKNTPSTNTRTAHTGVCVLVSALAASPAPSGSQSQSQNPLLYTHSTERLTFCRCWLNSARCPIVVVSPMNDGGSGRGSIAVAVYVEGGEDESEGVGSGVGDGVGSAGRPCWVRTR